MRVYLLIFALIGSSLAYGQPPRKTVKTKSRYLLEQYEVSAANDTIRSGMYRRYFRDGKILLEEGEYADNKRLGIWTFYNGKGKPELIYDYSAHKILVNNRMGLDSTGVIQQDGQNQLVVLSPPPTFLASMYQITGILVRESKLPINLQRAGATEVSYQVLATVSPAGAYYKVITSHDDREFIKNAQESASAALNGVSWVPGMYQGQDVTAIYKLPAVVIGGFSVTRSISQP